MNTIGIKTPSLLFLIVRFLASQQNLYLCQWRLFRMLVRVLSYEHLYSLFIPLLASTVSKCQAMQTSTPTWLHHFKHWPSSSVEKVWYKQNAKVLVYLETGKRPCVGCELWTFPSISWNTWMPIEQINLRSWERLPARQFIKMRHSGVQTQWLFRGKSDLN